ncbi:proline-rich receptor-like protein kinase PERK12 [Iris pallida]|uniref:Proline-rich receptor-like protein kinase PERK12 n=1 Tax=Iris pallida TaxID=29817 RepID=A0AAX6G2U1_IRIPA|nr:proline-rich receptor-like protein kinase PERK12 [Iris pallida]
MDETGPSILFSISGFFTPTVLFVFLNLVIATIALTSRTVRRQNNQEPAADDQALRPGPTGLDRVRSIGLFRFGSRDLPQQPEPDHHTQQTHYHQDPPPSVLERVRSGLFGFGSRDAPQQPESDRRTQQTHYHEDTPPSVLERVRSGLFGLGSRDIPQPEPDQTIHTQTHYHQHAPQQSALERVRSGLFRVGSRDNTPQPETHDIQTETAEPEPEHYDMEHHFRRIQSESALPKPFMAEERGTLRKLASALSWRAPDPDALRRRPVAAREEAPPPSAVVEEEEGEEVDARADDFINRFKQQLKLQRLDSILRYKEMLTRGSAR